VFALYRYKTGSYFVTIPNQFNINFQKMFVFLATDFQAKAKKIFSLKAYSHSTLVCPLSLG